MRIYVCCPPRVATGGVELLHQMIFELNRRSPGIARMLYIDGYPEEGWLMPPQYGKYGTPFVANDYRRYDSIVILPEVWAEGAGTVFWGYKTVIWWESVDNYFLVNPAETWMSFAKNKSMLHLVQSEYARGFLTENAKVSEDRILSVSDYLNESFFTTKVSLKAEGRRPCVLYNPLKGFEFTAKLIEAAPDLEWIPLRGMTPEQVANLMRESRVYVDFGDHPGKDRIPREAAICGCCVITGRNGSATYPEDVPISGEYKFGRDEKNIPAICDCIRRLVNEYDTYISDFAYYRAVIRGEKEKFEKAVANLIPVLEEYCRSGEEDRIGIAVCGADSRGAAARKLIEQAYNKWLEMSGSSCRFEVRAYVTQEPQGEEYREVSVIRPEQLAELYKEQQLAGIVIPEPAAAAHIPFVTELVRKGIDLNDVYCMENKWFENDSGRLSDAGTMLMPWANR
ncbi:MAG: hypothetical protein NC541_02925 [bacterium]|nr:hypothetical protein [bacterium]